ncbi:MAG: hypothetical protein K2M06_05330 [Muribaculaceae bacterium]|nr:hypothetical protein [Muribaculaceae bacterium]
MKKSIYPIAIAGLMLCGACSEDKGTRLAAVTTGGLASGNITDVEHVSMTVDRPFYYLVRNMTTNAVLLIGRVCNFQI